MGLWALVYEDEYDRYSSPTRYVFEEKTVAKEAGEMLFANEGLEWKGDEIERLQIAGTDVKVKPQDVHEEVPKSIRQRHKRRKKRSPINDDP